MSELDQMVAYAVAALASGNAKRTKTIVRDLAEDWPSQPALSVSFALTSAAAELEKSTGGCPKAANAAFRLAALVAADIMAIQSMGQNNAKAKHLLHFWRRVDPFFLETNRPIAKASV